MLSREIRQQTQNIVETVGATCDRCGKDMRRVSGAVGIPSSWPFAGLYVGGSFYPTQNIGDMLMAAAELCEPCGRELVEWIGKGAGVGARVRDAIEASKEITDVWKTGSPPSVPPGHEG